MEELKVLIESVNSGRETRSVWFNLPIERSNLEEALGIDEGSSEYLITDMQLPFSDEVGEYTLVERLNELYHMYEALPSYIKQEYRELIDYFDDLEELFSRQSDIIYYEGCNSMEDAAKIELRNNPNFSSLSEKAVKYFNYKAYARHLSERHYFVEMDSGIFRIPR